MWNEKQTQPTPTKGNTMKNTIQTKLQIVESPFLMNSELYEEPNYEDDLWIYDYEWISYDCLEQSLSDEEAY